MSRWTAFVLASLGLLLLQGACGDGGGGPGVTRPPMTAVECADSVTEALAEGVFFFRRGLYSTLFVTTPNGIIAFDPLSTEAECLGKAMQAHAPGLQVQHLVYTSSDADHIAWATRLPLSPAVRVYAHQLAADDLARRGSSPGIRPVTDPLWVGQDGQPTTLMLLSRRVQLDYFGPTHGNGNLLVTLPDAGVALLVDVLLADALPGTVLASLSPQGVLRTLGALDQRPVRQVVVGHGAVASKEDVSRTLSYWAAYLSAAQTALANQPPRLTEEEQLRGAPLLRTLAQLPTDAALAALRPDFGTRLGFTEWGENGFPFAYLYLQGESPTPVPLLPVDAPTPPPMSWQQIGRGAYYAQVGPYGSLVFDPDPAGAGQALLVVDPLGAHAAHLRRQIGRYLPGRKVGHIVYTHAHNDRIANASALCDGDLSGVRIYAHELAARALSDRKNPSVAQPNQIVTGAGLDLSLSGHPLQLRYFGPGHTDGNLIVYLPESKIAVAADLVQRGAAPGLLAVETDPAGLHRTLRALAALGPEVTLTGQGGYLTPMDLQQAARAAEEMFQKSAAFMRDDAALPTLPLSAQVAPALRGTVVQIGDKVAHWLGAAYPELAQAQKGALGELGVTFCSAQADSLAECEVR